MERFVWLYSGAVTGWWCYDDDNNILINKMYLEFCKNQTKHCNKLVKKKTKKDVVKYDQIKVEIKSTFEETTELVDFGDFSEEPKKDTQSVLDSDISIKSVSIVKDELIDKFNIEIDNEHSKNIIQIAGSKYKIDFDRMLQINYDDIKKRRCIMCLKISENIFNNPLTLKKYLIDHKVKGVAGKLFG